MSTIQISTITPVHIGSGNFLQYNIDFVEDKVGDDSFIYIVDPNKIAKLIGIENIGRWVSIIENNGDIKDFVRKFSSAKSPEEYAVRVINNYASNIISPQTLKETIHNGFGLPYIPGSSIKGAIRTAILASLVDQVQQKEEKIINRNKMNKLFLSDKKIQDELFGDDPKNDLFRFLQVGDAYF